MNCNKCGTVNQPGTKFCVNCGNNLENVTTPVVPETPELPGLANPAPVAPAAPAVEPAPVAPAPVVAEPAAPAAPVVEEPTGPLLEPITQPQLAPNLLATQVLPTVTPETVAPTPAPAAPVVEPTPVAPVQPTVQPVQPAVAPTPVQPTVAPVQPGVAPVAPTAPVAAPKKGFNKKLLIPIVAVVAVALIVAGILIVPKLFGGAGADELAAAKMILDTDRPIPFKKDGKYGFISSKGKVIIEAKYESVGDFYGDYAVVAIENDDDDYDWLEYKYQIVNQKGKEQLDEAVMSEPEYYGEYGIWVIEGKLYNDSLKQTSKEGDDIEYVGQGYVTYSNMDKDESGIMTHNGKKVWSWDGWSISADLSENEYGDDDLYATVNSYLDDEQEVIVSLKKKKIVYELEDREDNYISEEDNGVFKVSNTDTYTHTYLYFYNGKLAYESSDTDLEGIEVYDYDQQILRLDYGYNSNYDYEYKYYDVKKEKEIEKPTDVDEDEEANATELKYGFKEFESSYKYGIISGDQILIQSKYEDVEFLEYAPFLYMKEVKNKELVLLETEDEYILMNVRNAKEIARFDADYVGMSQTSSFLKFSQYEDYYDTDKYIVYNLITGEQKEFDGEVEIELGSNYITVEDDDKITYYNTKLESIYTIED